MKQIIAKAISRHTISIIIPFLILGFESCNKKEVIIQTSTNSSLNLNVHVSKIYTWLKLIPINGEFKGIDHSNIKTVTKDGLITSKLEIGVNSLYFISSDKEFHVYGVNSTQLKKTRNKYNGIVEIYDFQTLSKKGAKYIEGNLSKLLIYPNKNPIMNAYRDIYPDLSNKKRYEPEYFKNNLSPNNLYIPLPINNKHALNEKVIKLNSTSQLGNIIDGVRKFFCELFGGVWVTYPYASDGSFRYCTTGGSNDQEAPQELPPPEASGNPDYGTIWLNLNNPDYFVATSTFWSNIYSGLNAGGINLNLAVTGSNILDSAFTDVEKARSIYYILNAKYNQQPSQLYDGTLDEILNNFDQFYNSNEVAVPIIPLLLKATINGAADALTQALMIYLTEDNCPSFGAAFGNPLFNKLQVGRSSFEGIFFWKTPGGKIGRASASAALDVIANAVSGKYGMTDYSTMGSDFMLGFFSDLAGGEIGELASKYSIPKIGKGLLNKFHLPYKTVTSWLGGGVEIISKSFSHPAAYGGSITANRVIKGYAKDKIAVIGRSMDDRVIPYAQYLSQELGINVTTIKQWSGWNSNLTVEQNRTWIQKLKNEGYTIYDIGRDPGFLSGALTGGTPDLSYGDYYLMELEEIFQ